MSQKIKLFIHHYFLPHHSNNYKAKTLHHPFLLFYILLLTLLQTAFIFVKRIDPNILGYATDITVEKLLFLINEERTKANLEPLRLSPELTQAAQEKAADMFNKNYWAHISPTGTTPWEFITGSGYQYIYAGENLAKSFDTTDQVVAAWMKSPTHRTNILKKEYTEIGFAVLNGQLTGEETTLVVQEFGSRVLERPQEISMVESSEDNYAGIETPLVSTNVPPIQTAEKKVPFLHFRITKTVSFLVAEFLLVVLFIDSILIWKHKTVRISGHSLTHIMFLLALLGAMGATGIGAIL